MAETANFYRIMNFKLNELKAARPDDRAVIESFQTSMNKQAQLISPDARRALLKFPMQFVQPLRTSDRDWTTQLHIWAAHKLPELLMIDPIVLTAKDSNDDCVLKCLVDAALGRMTEMIDYDFLRQLLQKDMNYNAVTVPGDTENTEPGNAWYERDLDGKTVAEHLYDFAAGEGAFEGQEKNLQLLDLFERYAESALKMEGEEEEKESPFVDDGTGKKEEKTPEMDPNEENTEDATEKLDVDGDAQGAIELDEDGNYRPVEPESAEGGEGDAQNLFKVLLKLGSLLK